MTTPEPNEPSASIFEAGFPRLAEEMAKFPRSAHFSTFTILRAELLLHDQDEILALANQYRLLQVEDRESGHDKRAKLSKDWSLAAESEALANGDSPWQSVRVERMLREKMQQYCEFVNPDNCRSLIDTVSSTGLLEFQDH